MSKVDEELTRRLRGAERPVEVDGLFEALERRRGRRERARRVQSGFLALAVIAATLAGFLTLQYAFGGRGRNVGHEQTPSPVSNGEIVFSRLLPDGSEHLFAVQPGREGERRITAVGQASYREPSISPDGQTIVVAHSIPSFEGEGRPSVIATVPIEGGAPKWLTDPVGIVQDPEWSPDGARIAFAGDVPGGGGPGIHVMNADGSEIRLIAGSDSFDVLSPDWSPDGSRIVFTGWNDGVTQPDIYSVALDGSNLTNLTETPDVDEEAPAWSPDGSRIAFVARPLHDPHGTIDLITTEGEPAGRVSEIGAGVVLDEIDWSPDGRFLAFLSDLALTDSDTDGDLDVWIVRPNGSDLKNLTTEGASGIAWQPLPAGSETSPTVSPGPNLSPSPEAGGRDFGLGFPVCQVSSIRTQFDGVGGPDTAFVATGRADDGSCPPPESAAAYVAVDLDDDGLADESFGPIRCSVYYCRAFATPDLDADVGRHELMVVESAGSIEGLGIYALGVVDGPAGDEPGIVRIEVGEPDDPAGGFVTGEPVTLYAGGDEGWSYRLSCEDRPEGRVLVAASAYREVDSSGPVVIHETTLAYGELRMIVVDVVEHEEPVSDDPLGPQPDDLCGTPIPRI